jgi:hypothetical protein
MERGCCATVTPLHSIPALDPPSSNNRKAIEPNRLWIQD